MLPRQIKRISYFGPTHAPPFFVFFHRLLIYLPRHLLSSCRLPSQPTSISLMNRVCTQRSLPYPTHRLLPPTASRALMLASPRTKLFPSEFAGSLAAAVLRSSRPRYTSLRAGRRLLLSSQSSGITSSGPDRRGRE